jgi:hypothetical protein
MEETMMNPSSEKDRSLSVAVSDVADAKDDAKDDADAKDADKHQAAVSLLLGSQIVCTLRDGRKARGKLVCVDRL